MSEQIKVGDLVVVVRVNHRCSEYLLGRIGVVNDIPVTHIGIECNKCGMHNLAFPNSPVAVITLRTRGWVPLSWLKKIPPLSEPETVERKQTEPA